MIIIWGTKGVVKVLEEGLIKCPVCSTECTYELKTIRKYFTFFWIPLIPLGTMASCLECQQCKTAFNPECFLRPDSTEENLK